MNKDFRKHPAEWVGPAGKRMLVQVCEEFVDGRWEGTIVILPEESAR
jgi:hypothetical protein